MVFISFKLIVFSLLIIVGIVVGIGMGYFELNFDYVWVVFKIIVDVVFG